VDDPKTYGVKYIGSKLKLLRYIRKSIEGLEIESSLDLFTGTTRVAQLLRSMGIKTDTVDMSWASEGYANTFVHGVNHSRIGELIEEANTIKPVDGWLTENYSGINYERVCVWQPQNTRKADGIRDWIVGLDESKRVKDYLVTSLIFGLDAVDNTVGVQQAYLKTWCSRSYNDLSMRVFDLDYTKPRGKHTVGDALKVKLPSVDLVYIDPPYSSHNYLTYYHIWDSIYRWDKPEVGLTTNRRADRINKAPGSEAIASLWNRKKEALGATEEVLGRLDTKYALVSYSSDGLMDFDSLVDLCFTFGSVSIEAIDYKRHVMSKIGNAETKLLKNLHNTEFLILISM